MTEELRNKTDNRTMGCSVLEQHIMSEQEILQRSSGEVSKAADPVLSPTGTLIFEKGSIGDPLIFGSWSHSDIEDEQEDSIRGNVDMSIEGVSAKIQKQLKRSGVDAMKSRRYRTGHIELGLPFVNPMIYAPRAELRLLFGLKTETFENLCTGKGYLFIFWDSKLVEMMKELLKCDLSKVGLVEKVTADLKTKQQELSKQFTRISLASTPKGGSCYYVGGDFLKTSLGNLILRNVFGEPSLEKIQTNNRDSVTILLGGLALYYLTNTLDLKVELAALTKFYKDALPSNVEVVEMPVLKPDVNEMNPDEMEKVPVYKANTQRIKEISRRWNLAKSLLASPAGESNIKRYTSSVWEVIPVNPFLEWDLTYQDGEKRPYPREDLPEYLQLVRASLALKTNIGVFWWRDNPDMHVDNVRNWYKKVPFLSDTVIKNIVSVAEILTSMRDRVFNLLGSKEGLWREHNISRRYTESLRVGIVSGPELEIGQIGVSAHLLLSVLESHLPPMAKKIRSMLDSSDPEKVTSALKIIKNAVENKGFVAIRYPTLQRQNITGYLDIIPIPEKVIRLHPLLCVYYNADFDGDQMSGLLISTKQGIKDIENKLNPHSMMWGRNGNLLIKPSQDMVLGLYALSMTLPGGQEVEEIEFADELDCIEALENGMIKPTQPVRVYGRHYSESVNREFLKLRLTTGFVNEKKPKETDFYLLEDFQVKSPRKLIHTTAGRVLLNSLIPQNIGIVDREVDKYTPIIDKLLEERKCFFGSKEVSEVLSLCAERTNTQEDRVRFAKIADDLKSYGFKYATYSGLTISIADIQPPKTRAKMVKELKEELALLNSEEIDDYKAVVKTIECFDELKLRFKTEVPDDNPIKIIALSGSRGNMDQVAQLSIGKGAVKEPSGKLLPYPILSSLSE